MIDRNAGDDADMAQNWLRDTLGASPGVMAALAHFVELILAENARQNLIAKSTEATIWWRHIVDSAQLPTLVAEDRAAHPGHWVDLGSGPGLPGIVAAILRSGPVTLVEMRPARTDFLDMCVSRLGLANVKVYRGKVEKYREPADIISARAFAPLPQVIAKARHLAHPKTVWLLPKGKNAVNELADLPEPWHSAFHVKQSVTSPQSAILIGKGQFGGKTA